MQVAGVQPVGSKGLSGLQLVVSNDQQQTRTGLPARNDAPRALAPVSHTLISEPVVFPRDGLPLDQRPTQLRQTKAATRYREAQELEPRRRPRHARR